MELVCSFCQKLQQEGDPLIKGKDAVICAKCLQNGNAYVENVLQGDLDSLYLRKIGKKIPSPKEIHHLLDEHIIAQKQAKKVLSVAVYTHYRRLFANADKRGSTDAKTGNDADDVELEKSNILLTGPTGSGKTLLASTLAKIVNVPFAIADATTLTEAGYVGDDVENILLRLLQNADYNVGWAEKGIIFLDELDKIGRKSENASITRDVSGEGVQQALLKIIEGTVAKVPVAGGRKHPQAQTIAINTKDILFICGGAFVGLENIIDNRIGKKNIGFKTLDGDAAEDRTEEGTTAKDLAASKKHSKKVEAAKKDDGHPHDIHSVTPDDLIKYGLIPELVGRLPIVVGLVELSDQELIKVLTEPKNALIRQYKKLLSLENITLDVQQSAFDVIVNRAKKLKTGARSLRSIMEDIMLDILYEAPQHRGKKVFMSADTLKKGKHYFS